MSKIEWTDKTWNPIRARDKETGKDGWFCVHASEGCRNCYAEDLNLNRRNLAFGNGHAYAAQNRDKVDIYLHEKTLLAPLRWRKPRKVFVCSMTDLFGDFHSRMDIARVFSIMALCPQHTFQVLTKRAGRMRATMPGLGRSVWWWLAETLSGDAYDAAMYERENLYGDDHPWPLPNVWLGVSVEDQKTADARVPDLLATPAAVRFVSYEPALGPVDFTMIDDGEAHREVPKEEWGSLDDDDSPPGLWWDALTGGRTIMHGGSSGEWRRTDASIDQVIFGGESGSNRRPAQMDWGRAVRDQCRAAGVAFFGKQNDKVAALPDDLMIREWPR